MFCLLLGLTHIYGFKSCDSLASPSKTNTYSFSHAPAKTFPPNHFPWHQLPCHLQCLRGTLVSESALSSTQSSPDIKFCNVVFGFSCWPWPLSLVSFIPSKSVPGMKLFHIQPRTTASLRSRVDHPPTSWPQFLYSYDKKMIPRRLQHIDADILLSITDSPSPLTRTHYFLIKRNILPQL